MKRRPCPVALVALWLAAALIPARAGAQIPLLDMALTCGRGGEVGGPRPGLDLYRLVVDAAAFPDAVCNDGTRAVFYVRQACPTTPEYQNYWHIHLEGGGNCNTPQSCANRWCSHETNFGAAQMSSRNSPRRMRARGIFDRSVRNDFRCWNHVYVRYCSSDNWSGEGTVAQVTADDPADLAVGCTPGVDCTPIDYRIHFRGATIVDAVRSQLRRDCNGAACPATDFAIDQNNDGVLDWAMPDLDDADGGAPERQLRGLRRRTYPRGCLRRGAPGDEHELPRRRPLRHDLRARWVRPLLPRRDRRRAHGGFGRRGLHRRVHRRRLLRRLHGRRRRARTRTT